MNRFIAPKFVLPMAFMFCLAGNVSAQPLASPCLFAGGTRCDHVIQMMLRHGVNNSLDRSSAHSLLSTSRLNAHVVPTQEVGDLQIVQITQLPPDAATSGPKLSVMVSNHSVRSVCRFHVTAVAIFGHITPDSPSTTIAVPQINAGETTEVILSLPIEALSMGNRNGDVLGFQSIVVVIDSYDEWMESNEANNLRALEASELRIAEVAIGEATALLESSDGQTAFVQSEEVASPAATNSPAQPSVNGDVSVDQLDLEHATQDSLRSAIQQVRATEPAPRTLAPQVNPQAQIPPSSTPSAPQMPQATQPQQVEQSVPGEASVGAVGL